MTAPDRKFVGGIKKIDPQNLRARELAHNQAGGVFGIIHDYAGEAQKPAIFVQKYNSAEPKKREAALRNLLDYLNRIKTYAEHMKTVNGITREKHPAVFADDIKPYVETLDEIVDDLKQLGGELKKEHDTNGESVEFKLILMTIEAKSLVMHQIIKPVIGRVVSDYSANNNLRTNPLIIQMMKEEPITEAEALERIMKKLEYGKQVLKKGPLPGSFSYVRRDGSVLPIDWEPNRNNERKLKNARQ